MTPFMEDLAKIGCTAVDFIYGVQSCVMVFRLRIESKKDVVRDLRRISAVHGYVLTPLFEVDYYTDETELTFLAVPLQKITRYSGLDIIEISSSEGKLFITLKGDRPDQRAGLERAFGIQQIAVEFVEVNWDADRLQNEFVYSLLTDNGLKW